MPFITAHWRAALPALALAAFAFAAPAPGATQDVLEPPTIGAQDFSQSQLESFVAAATKVNAITDQLQLEAQGIESPADLAELQEQANLDMVAAVEEEGLTVEEYNMIFEVAQVDPEMNAALLEMMQR